MNAPAVINVAVVAKNEDAGLAEFRVREPRGDAIPETLAARNARYRCPERCEMRRQQLHHSIDCARIPTWAFTFDRGAQIMNRPLGIEGNGKRIKPQSR